MARRILTPVIATLCMLWFWRAFADVIPSWWITVAILLLAANYVYSFYRNRLIINEKPSDYL